MRQTKRLLALVLALVMTLSLTVLDTSAARTGGGKITITSDTALTGKVAYTEITIKNGADVMVGKNTDILGVKKINIENGQLSLNGKLATEALTIGENGAVQFGANSQLSASGKTEIYTDTPFTGADNDQFQPTGTVVSKTEGGATEANKYSGKTTATVDENLTPSEPTPTPTPTEQEVAVTKLEITGMTGDSGDTKNTTDDTPVVGDTLKAVTTPANAKVTYQWYTVVGGEATAISGATSATYKVKSGDFGETANSTTIRVVIAAVEGSKTTVSPVATEAVTANAVCRNLADYAKINLEADDAGTSDIDESIPTIGDVFEVTVTDKTASVAGTDFGTVNTQYRVKWYIDSVSGKNELTDGTEITLDGDGISVTPKADHGSDLIGHKLIVVLTGGDAANGYLGTVQATTKAVQADLEDADYTVSVKNEAGNEVAATDATTKVQVGEKMTASIESTADDDVTPTVTWKWILGYGGTNAQVLSTTNTYTLTKEIAEKLAADADATQDNGEMDIKVIATGTGNFARSKARANDIANTMVSTDAPALSVKISNEATAQLGSPLTAAVSPAAYNSATYVTYQWYKDVVFAGGGDNGAFTDGTAISGATSASYTPPKDSASTRFGVKITAKSNAVTVASGTYGVTVGNPISGATLNVANVTATAAGRTQNIVGDTLTVTASDGVTALTADTDFTVKWYKGSVSDANEIAYNASADGGSENMTGTGDAHDSYKIQKADYANGNTIIAVVVGKGTYSGTKTLTKTFGNIYLAAAAVATLDKGAPSIGDTITASVTAAGDNLTNSATYQWYRLTKAQYAELGATDANGKTLTAAEKLKKVKDATILTGETNKTYTATVDDYNTILACVATTTGCVKNEVFATTETAVPAPAVRATNTTITGITFTSTKVTVSLSGLAVNSTVSIYTDSDYIDANKLTTSVNKTASDSALTAEFAVTAGTVKPDTTYYVVVTPQSAEDKLLYEDAEYDDETDAAVATFLGTTAVDGDNAVTVVIPNDSEDMTTTDAIAVFDQFGNKMTTASTDSTKKTLTLYTDSEQSDDSGYTATLTWDNSGAATWTASANGGDINTAKSLGGNNATWYTKLGDCVITVTVTAS